MFVLIYVDDIIVTSSLDRCYQGLRRVALLSWYGSQKDTKWFDSDTGKVFY
jgi:hypothetical protein